MTERKVLIVEDDALQYRVASQHLCKAQGARFAVDWAPTFEEGLQRLLEGGHDVCLLDYQLGERDGLALLREARARGCTTPVIFLTADSSAEVDLAAMEAGAADYLVKGEISPRILERSVRYALKLAETLAELRRLATHDALTGLLNRRAFERILAEERDRAQRFGHPFSLVLFDLDHFKAVNDRHGHPAGDAVLREVAARLLGALRSVDRLARFGGEEFVAILVEVDRAGALEVVRGMVAAVAATPVPAAPGLALPMTASAGVALFPEDGRNEQEIVAAADRALYAAKRAGRNRVVLASEERGEGAATT